MGIGAVSLRVKRSGREAENSLSSSAEAKERVELYLHSPNKSWRRGAYLSTGTTLSLLCLKSVCWRSTEIQTDMDFCCIVSLEGKKIEVVHAIN
jgi:hypothetical protein